MGMTFGRIGCPGPLPSKDGAPVAGKLPSLEGRLPSRGVGGPIFVGASFGTVRGAGMLGRGGFIALTDVSLVGPASLIPPARAIKSCWSPRVPLTLPDNSSDAAPRAPSIGLRGKVASMVLNLSRSEERRVGKECRSRWSPDH